MDLAPPYPIWVSIGAYSDSADRSEDQVQFGSEPPADVQHARLPEQAGVQHPQPQRTAQDVREARQRIAAQFALRHRLPNTIVPILGAGLLADRIGPDLAVCFCTAAGLLMAAMLWQTRRLLPLRAA
ncbi:hypothetical protein GPA19_10380 [Azoarcus indigens]|uniref:Uncharacterized protein n=1 Tax=Azoarcus indigens TaxID=29545 RepID=A0A4R6EGU8_9RHOO|nr:hypothetical protein [Azoarcus indigens]NMG65354.1 hypothetical protein [Azoarcus indigens]TDN56738.1 hypothetical protein C7389_101117 [Azoarcus indigens]